MERNRHEPAQPDRDREAIPALAELDPQVFDAAEVALLTDLRNYHQTDPRSGHALSQAQARRNEFARWLVEHGRIGEELPDNGLSAVEGYEPELTWSAESCNPTNS